MKNDRLFPWIRRFWESLSDEDREKVARGANAICRYAANDQARVRVISEVQQLCDTFEVIAADCEDIIQSPEFRDVAFIPSSDLDYLVNYFEQFNRLISMEHKKETIPVKERKYKLKNDYYGILDAVLVRETGARFYFKCYKGDEVVMESWALAKDSPRILEGDI